MYGEFIVMPFAVQLFFDSMSESIIGGILGELAKEGIFFSAFAPTIRPSLTLALYDQLDSTACASKLRVFAELSSPFALTFSSLGIFPGGKATFYLAPTVDQKLLDVQAYIHQLLKNSATSSLTNYASGDRISHCALALDLDKGLLARAIEIGLSIPFPLHCRVDEIGLAEYWPMKQLCSFGLGGA
jgi:hypothetical protein